MRVVIGGVKGRRALIPAYLIRLVVLIILVAAVYWGMILNGIFLSDSSTVSASTHSNSSMMGMGNFAPIVEAVIPRNSYEHPRGVTQTYNFLCSDLDGSADIKYIECRIGTYDWSDATTISILYDRARNVLGMKLSSGGSQYGELGSSTILQNNKVRIDLSKAGAQHTTNLIYLEVHFEFKPDFAGRKYIWVKATDMTYLNSGWVNMSSIIVTDGSHTPRPISVTPRNGRGYAWTFEALYFDRDAATDIKALHFLINSSRNANNAVYLIFFPDSRILHLRNDREATWQSGPIGYRRAGHLNNSQVRVQLYMVRSSISTLNTNYMTLRVYLEFKPSFVGEKNIYMKAVDRGNHSTTLRRMGHFTVTSGSNVPEPVFVDPATGFGPARRGTMNSSVNFVASYSDYDGYEDLKTVYFLLSNRSSEKRNRVYIEYKRFERELSLWNDRASRRYTAPLGASGVLGNGQVAIDLPNTSAFGRRNQLTLRLPMSFKNGFVGNWNIYMQVVDHANHNMGWRKMGTFRVTDGSAIPLPEQVLPILGSGRRQKFTAKYRDADGAADLHFLEFLVHTRTDDFRNCVHLYYDASDQKLYLHNDGSTGFRQGEPGSAGFVSNGQALIALSDVAIRSSSARVEIDLPIIFDPSFVGTKNVYLKATDYHGHVSTWRHLGVFEVTSSTAENIEEKSSSDK